MRVLFIHQNIPGQFRHVIGALCADPSNSVWAIGGHRATARAVARFPRLNVVSYAEPGAQTAGHPWLVEVDAQLRRGQLVARALQQIKDKGIGFDVIVAHPGWGEAMFVKDLFPATPLLAYFEFFYSATGADVGFDPEFPSGPERALRLRVRNMPHLAALNACDAGFTPTRWQHSRLPGEYRGRVAVVHEGVDTDAIRPDAAARFEWQGRVFEAGQPVVTYVARNLEPYRGFHVFMRALPALLAAEPLAQVIVVGGDEVSYGTACPHPEGWRAALTGELARAGTPLDTSRVHFVGKLPYAEYLKVLQVSAAHVYLDGAVRAVVVDAGGDGRRLPGDRQRHGARGRGDRRRRERPPGGLLRPRRAGGRGGVRAARPRARARVTRGRARDDRAALRPEALPAGGAEA